MCIINHGLDNWECFMNARSASQALGPSVWSPEHQEGESHEGFWPFPFCLINARMQLIDMKWSSSATMFHFRNNAPEMTNIAEWRFVLPGRHLPQQSAAVWFQRSLLGGWTDAGGHLEVQSPQWLPVCGGHQAQGQTFVPKELWKTAVQYVSVYSGGLYVFKLLPVSWICTQRTPQKHAGDVLVDEQQRCVTRLTFKLLSFSWKMCSAGLF